MGSCHKSGTDPDGSNDNPQQLPKTLAVASVLQNNMVLQRDVQCKIWGTVTPGATVAVTVSWSNTPVTTTSDANGNWQLSLPASAANSTPQTITCKSAGQTDVVLNNILIGDVWLCSGQSNMAMPVAAIAPFTGVLDYQNEIAAANYPAIRTLTVPQYYADKPAAMLDAAATWKACSPQNAGELSAVAYYFARKIHTTLNVPIGIVISAVNGSYCQEWMNKEAFSTTQLQPYSSGSKLYNGMINPLINLNIKGFLWYQGENNQHDPPSDYTALNAALISSWRKQFSQGDLPFYLVQLTPFAEDYNNTNPPGGNPENNWLAYFREGQSRALTVKNTGMAITMDVGEAANHHPRDKKPVGERLALLALRKTYNLPVQCYGPQFAGYSISGNAITISFADGTANGLNTIGNAQLNQLFFVAGDDHNLIKADAQIIGSTVRITIPASLTSAVKSIRYAFTNAAITNLQNDAGLPAEPFRTDSW
ncbi:sialate O-acetylesterase [Mucilaginibacter yixingensis]|uniref:sialate O-acetylesterase n=1 Tax=Mucilaginibacter yixingensis TaxID=1295612 RepID=UPI0011B26033|nr:sialate O-acetylesterase [Mucilaginibacter yixingensis]